MGSDFLFVVFELQAQHLVSCFTILLKYWRTYGLAIRTAYHLNNTGVVGALGVLIAAHVHRKVHQNGLVHIPGRHGQPDFQIFHCPPVLQAHGGVLQWALRLKPQCGCLFFWKI